MVLLQLDLFFYEKSPRTISINNAKSISKHLPKTIARVGVFVNHEKDFIRLAISEVPLDMIQITR